MPKGIYERTKKLNRITIDENNPEIAYIHIESRTYGSFKAMIDSEDVELVRNYTWHILKDKNTFYVRCHIYLGSRKTKVVSMHRLICNFTCSQVDHISGIGFDNRKSNLRLVTNAQNQRNQLPRKNTSSVYKGVSWSKGRGKWVSRICYNYKDIYLGYFNTEEEGARTYDKKAKELFGEYARTNFPISDYQ